MSYELDLNQIEFACHTAFGRDIEVRPRAIQALVESIKSVSLLNHEFALTSDLECFRGVLAASPACTDAILRQDISLQTLISAEQQSKSTLRNAPRIGSYDKLLSDIFVSRWPFPSGLNDVGIKVRATGILTETDLFIGCLQAGRMNVLPNNTAKGLLTAAGLYEDECVDIRGDEYLANLEANCAPVLSLDASHSEQQLILYLDSNERLRVHTFGANALGVIEDRLSKAGTFVFRGGVLQPALGPSLFAADSIAEFEDLINSKNVLEQKFQDFFKRHPEFLKSLDFEKIHPQPILYKDDGSKLIPDFFLEQIDCGWHAIADLKRPYDHMVIRKKNRVYFAQWIQDAIAQLQYYKEWFEDAKHRNEFERTQGLSTKVYRPKMVLIAGRSTHFTDDVERIRLLSAQDANLSLWTYDDVLRRAQRYKAFAEGHNDP